jgi:putative two-component system response regulator
MVSVRRAAESLQQEIQDAQEVAMLALAEMARCRDSDTQEHLLRTRSYAQILAARLARSSPYSGQIDRQFLHNVYRASPLHDIGKLVVNDAILLKPGPLTPEQYEEMKQHTIVGGEILEEAARRHRGGRALAMAAVVARCHHERFDGSGYPAGLKGQAIPLPARIVSLADVYDALTSSRCYKPAYSAVYSRSIIERGSGTQFDPEIVAAFRASLDEFDHVLQQNEARSQIGDESASVAAASSSVDPRQKAWAHTEHSPLGGWSPSGTRARVIHAGWDEVLGSRSP